MMPPPSQPPFPPPPGAPMPYYPAPAYPPVAPFAPPGYGYGAPPPPPTGPKLFTANAIAVSAFFASPLAGGLLLAWNFRQLRKTQSAVLTVALSLAYMLLFALFAVYTNLPGAVYSAMGMGSALGLRVLAAKVLPSTHPKASPWFAVLVSAGSLFLAFAVIVCAALVKPDPKVTFPNQVAVYYDDGAKETDARKVGDYLIAKRFIMKDADVRLSFPMRDEVKLAFTVNDGGWNDAAVVGPFQELASSVASDLFPEKRIKVVLLDMFANEKKTIVAGGSRLK